MASELEKRSDLKDNVGSDVQTSSSLELNGIDEKRLLRKIDLRIVPVMSLLYLLSFLDRTNIGNAAIFGLKTDLGLVGLQYSDALAIFFIAYGLFEVPSNLMIKIWRPSAWLPLLMVIWGATMIGMAFGKTFSQLTGTRFLLGAAEAGIYPGVTYYMTRWYRRREVALRISIFFSAASLAGAFGGLLSRLLNLLDGRAGLQGWRWIFLIEGILTMVIAAGSYFVLVDYPETVKFLTEAERDLVVDRLKADDNGLGGTYHIRHVRAAFLDWRVWLYAGSYFGPLAAVYSISLFSPSIITGLGYASTTAQLLSVPPYVLASITVILTGWLSDRSGKRWPFVLSFIALGIVGFILLIASSRPGVQYAGLFLGAAGVYPQISLQVAWAGNNVPHHTKRAVAMAIVVTIGIFGGFSSCYVYRSQDSPRYLLGHAYIIGVLAFSFICASITTIYLSRANAEKQRLRDRPYSADERAEYEDAGEDAPFFFFVL